MLILSCIILGVNVREREKVGFFPRRPFFMFCMKLNINTHLYEIWSVYMLFIFFAIPWEHVKLWETHMLPSTSLNVNISHWVHFYVRAVLFWSHSRVISTLGFNIPLSHGCPRTVPSHWFANTALGRNYLSLWVLLFATNSANPQPIFLAGLNIVGALVHALKGINSLHTTKLIPFCPKWKHYN